MSGGEHNEALAQLRALHKRFADVHRIGMECLERGDYQRLAESLKTERELIEEQDRLIKRLRGF